jgi:peptidoglycan/LPS O-acetylase OafA/YrhL
MVMMCHSHSYFAKITDYHLPAYLNYILMNGDKGVTLFFLMSAFTLCLSLDSKNESEPKPVRNYFIRRFFRIVPLYYSAILLVLLFQIAAPPLSSIFANLFFVHAFSPYWINSVVPGGWSVGIEVLFYLIFPFLFFKIKSLSGAINVTLISILAAKVITSLMFKNQPIDDNPLWGTYIYESFISQLPVFLMGICLFHIRGFNANSDKRSKLNQSYLFLAILIVFQVSGANIFKPHYLYAIAFGLLAFSLSKLNPKLIVNKLLAGIGKISYSLYLIHIVVANLLIKYNFTHYHSNSSLEVLIRFCIIFSISGVLSCITYYFIEVPFQTFGKHLIRKMENSGKIEPANLITKSTLGT